MTFCTSHFEGKPVAKTDDARVDDDENQVDEEEYFRSNSTRTEFITARKKRENKRLVKMDVGEIEEEAEMEIDATPKPVRKVVCSGELRFITEG